MQHIKVGNDKEIKPNQKKKKKTNKQTNPKKQKPRDTFDSWCF
jgi:hypothetical protein